MIGDVFNKKDHSHHHPVERQLLALPFLFPAITIVLPFLVMMVRANEQRSARVFAKPVACKRATSRSAQRCGKNLASTACKGVAVAKKSLRAKRAKSPPDLCSFARKAFSKTCPAQRPFARLLAGRGQDEGGGNGGGDLLRLSLLMGCGLRRQIHLIH